MRFFDLAKHAEGEIFGEDCEILRLSSDSESVEAGALFFCLTGGRYDGHDYALSAVKKGAVALVSEKKMDIPVPQLVVKNTRVALALLSGAFYGEPAKRLKIIGITGTNGKTTTCHMLAAILAGAGKKVGIIGTLGVSFGEKNYPCELTTPDPIPLHKIFAEMFLEGVEYAVMEVSAHAIHYNKIAGIPFTACIFTNLSQDHLDFFATMKAYKSTKKKLFLSEACPLAVINGDDEVGREFGALRERAGRGKTAYYGLTTPTDAFAIVTDESLQKTECMLNVNDDVARATLSFTGKHNVYNALAATACAKELGIDVLTSAKSLSRLQGVKGRLERVGVYNGGEIFVDFAHTPDGLEQSLRALKLHCKGRLLCLFGCGGNRDKKKRPIMGETVAKICDFGVLTSDNPRYEDPLDIITDIEKGYRRFSLRYVIVPDRKEAIRYAIDTVKKDDILLVAGKGGEGYQEIMGIKYDFNDNDIIGEIIKEKENSFFC